MSGALFLPLEIVLSKGCCDAMNARIEIPDSERLDPEALRVALSKGEAVVFPTDTVWGLGVAVEYAEGPEALYEMKGRDKGKPIAWLVAGPDALERYGTDLRPYVLELAQRFWPGALTLVVLASERVPRVFLAGGDTIALRAPDAPELIELMEELDSPLAATSANLSGEAPRASMGSKGVASTVVDCTGPAPKILREGELSEAIRAFVAEEIVDSRSDFDGAGGSKSAR